MKVLVISGCIDKQTSEEATYHACTSPSIILLIVFRSGVDATAVIEALAVILREMGTRGEVGGRIEKVRISSNVVCEHAAVTLRC